MAASVFTLPDYAQETAARPVCLVVSEMAIPESGAVYPVLKVPGYLQCMVFAVSTLHPICIATCCYRTIDTVFDELGTGNIEDFAVDVAKS